MKFKVNFNDKNSFEKIFHKDDGCDFVDGFLYDKKFLTEPKCDYEVDDMLCYCLVEGNDKVFALIPDGECGIDVYKVLNNDAVQSIKLTLDNFEED